MNHYLDTIDLPLFTSGLRFPMAKILLREGLDRYTATFDLFVRELPSVRNFLVFAGLEQVADYLSHLTFSADQLAWIRKTYGFTDREMRYFKHFRFRGDVWAMPEGTIFFPHEPIIRISAPFIEAQLIEMFLINAVYLQTILASKMARVRRAVGEKKLVVGWNRSYGTDAALKVARINQVFDAGSSLALHAYRRGESPFSAGTFHYLIMAFDDELAAYRAYLQHMEGKGFVLVDTYDTIAGVKRYIRAAKEFERRGLCATGIELDSGDLLDLSLKARVLLDKAGLRHVKIFAMGNLDEYSITRLERRHAPIDVYAGVTEIVVPSDAPTLELVYKLAELRSKNKSIPKMKISSKKVSLPGRKQVFRVGRAGRYRHDVIGLENERIDGQKLLIPIIKQGKLVYRFPTLEDIGSAYRDAITKFNPALRSIHHRTTYSVAISRKLRALAVETKKHIRSAHHDTSPINI